MLIPTPYPIPVASICPQLRLAIQDLPWLSGMSSLVTTGIEVTLVCGVYYLRLDPRSCPGRQQWDQPGPDGPTIDFTQDFRGLNYLPENEPTHYILRPTARLQLLDHLLKSNHARAAEESATEIPNVMSFDKPQRAKRFDEML